MSHSKPVIGYNLNGINELVVSEETGLLVPVNDQKEMAVSILKLLKRPDLIEKFGTNGYNNAQKHFTLNEMLIKHRNYLANL